MYCPIQLFCQIWSTLDLHEFLPLVFEGSKKIHLILPKARVSPSKPYRFSVCLDLKLAKKVGSFSTQWLPLLLSNGYHCFFASSGDASTCLEAASD